MKQAMISVLLVVGIFAVVKVVEPQATELSFDAAIVDGETMSPVSGVRVSVAGQTVVTGADGRFAFAKLLPGRYRLTAGKQGYMQLRPEGRKLGSPGIYLSISSTAGAAPSVFRMFRSGTVTGRVYDANGSPLPFLIVIPYRATYDNRGDLNLTRVILNPNSMAAGNEIQAAIPLRVVFESNGISGYSDESDVLAGMTNDLGEYRITNLEQGRYTFYVVPRGLNSNWTPMYYPGVGNAADAEIVEVTSGTEAPLRNVVLTRSAVRSKVHVRILDQVGEEGVGRVVQVRRKGVGETIRQTIGTTTGDLVGELPPGSYEIDAMIFKQPGVIASNSVTLELGSTDVAMDIPVSKGAKLSGTSMIHRKDSTTPVRNLQVVFKSRDTLPNLEFPLRSGPDGVFSTFARGSMPLGTYHVHSLSGVPPGLCIRTFQQGDRDVLRDGLRIAETAVTFDVVLEEAYSRVRGRVTNSNGREVDNAVVAAVPDIQTESHRYLSGVTDQHGRFELPCARPGSYTLYAWNELEGDAFRNVEFMKKYQGSGTVISVEGSGDLIADTELVR